MSDALLFFLPHDNKLTEHLHGKSDLSDNYKKPYSGNNIYEGLGKNTDIHNLNGNNIGIDFSNTNNNNYSETETQSSTNSGNAPFVSLMAVGPGELKNGTEYEGNGDTTVAIGSHGDNGANYSGGNLNGLSPGNTETQGHSGEDRFTATGRKITKIHGVDTVEINGETFIESRNGGILTEKTNSGQYKSQPLSIIEKDLQKTSQSLFGSPPSDSLYQQYYQALQDDLSPDEVRQRLASSPDEMSRLKSAISDIQGREATDGDMPWIAAQQSLLGNGSTTLQDIYKGTAAWTADHGGYDQIFEQIHGRAPTAEDRSYAATRIGDGWSVHTYRWNEAHSDDTKFTLSRIIEQVQNRQVTPGDSAWITGQQDDIGNSKQNMNDIRPALAKWSADHGAYDDVFKQVHGRSPSQADRDYAAARIGGNWSVQDYRWNEAHSDDVSIQLTNILSDSSLNKDVNLINNEIIKIQDDIGNNKISFDRASFLIKLGADLSTISNNTRPGDYTPVNSHKPGSYIYTSGSGKQFWVTSEYSFKDIVNNAKSSPPQREYKAFYDAIKSAVGHGGLYDAQRNSVNHVLYSENIDNANYNVGVWCAAYGMSEFEMNFLGDIYIYKTANSFTAAAATEARDLPLWNEGYKDYSTGYIK